MKNTLFILALVGLIIGQTGCMSSPISATQRPLSYPEWAVLGIGTAAGAAVGQNIDDTWGGPVGAAIGMAGTAAFLKYSNEREAQLVAEAKEEARREERGKLMQDYWLEASGSDSVGSWRGSERDVRYDAGIYDGIAYERREIPRQIYFQEPPR